MKVELRIDPACAEPTVTITAPCMTGEVESLMRALAGDAARRLTGFRDGEAELLDPADISRVYASGGKVYAVTPRGRFDLRMRLYEAERQLAGGPFARISNAELVNLDNVRSFDLRLSGTILVRLRDGDTTYVSRRHVAQIKRTLGLGGERK